MTPHPLLAISAAVIAALICAYVFWRRRGRTALARRWMSEGMFPSSTQERMTVLGWPALAGLCLCFALAALPGTDEELRLPTAGSPPDRSMRTRSGFPQPASRRGHTGTSAQPPDHSAQLEAFQANGWPLGDDAAGTPLLARLRRDARITGADADTVFDSQVHKVLVSMHGQAERVR